MDDLDRWFAQNVLPHEGVLTAYLRRVWPDSGESADLRQEIYVRVYNSGKKPAARRVLLFSLVPVTFQTIVSAKIVSFPLI